MKGIRFLFELRPVEDIAPWGGTTGDHRLSWFGLTDGWQCLDTAAGRLLEYAAPARSSEKTWVEYQVVRLFEDLLGAWPAITEPVPDDVASWFFGWYSRTEANRVAREETDCALDVAQLVAEQRKRETWPAAMLGRTTVTDWASVRRRLDELVPR